MNWKHGEDVIIAASLTDEEAHSRFPEGWRTERSYLRYIHEPPMAAH